MRQNYGAVSATVKLLSFSTQENNYVTAGRICVQQKVQKFFGRQHKPILFGQ